MKIIPNFLLEDESLEFEENKETNQLLLKGLGELHIEVIIDRFKVEHNLNIALGEVYVSYKESIGGDISYNHSIDKIFNNKLHYFDLEISIERMSDEDIYQENNRTTGVKGAKNSIVEVEIWPENSKTKKLYSRFVENMKSQSLNATDIKSDNNLFDNTKKSTLIKEDHEFHNKIIDSLYSIDGLKFREIYMIQQVLEDMTFRGPLLSSQLVNSVIKITAGKYNSKYFNDVALKMTTVECYLKAIRNLNINILEPICKIEINAERDVLQEIVNEALSKRGGELLEIGSEEEMKV